jgi:hypothetical protein
MIYDPENARRLYAPSLGSLISHLPDLGESLHTAAVNLAHDCSLARVDLMLAQLETGKQSLVHLRKALVADQELQRDCD